MAAEVREIELALDREGVKSLAALLLDRRQRHELAIGDKAGVIGEELPGAGEKITRSGFILADRPDTAVLFRPERATRSHQQDLGPGVDAIDDEPDVGIPDV